MNKSGSGIPIIRTLLANRSHISRLWIALSYALFLLLLIVIIGTFLDYGITYDENWQSTYGEHIIRWYASFFRDRGALTYGNLINYGGFFDVIAQLAAKVSPIGVFETRHLVNALFGALGVVGAYRLGKHLGGPLAGFLSALFLVLTPRYYGHAFNNPKDIPFATLFLFSLYYIIKSIGFLPRVPSGSIVKLGVAIGLALGVRAGGVLLIGYLALAFCLWLIDRYVIKRGHSSEAAGLGSALIGFGGRYFGICTIAYAVMLVWWPAAQVRPIVQPAKALLFSTRFEYAFDVFFEGRSIPNTDLPWYYVPKWVSITLPEFYFVALVTGLILAGISIVQFRDGISRHDLERTWGILVLLIAVFLPVAYSAVGHPVIYDGLRHFLFIVPLLAVIAAISVAKLVEQFSTSFVTVAVMIAILASMAIVVVDMFRLHPHEYIFFNRLFGKGVARAARSFETDYWGNSYKEGVEWIVRNYKLDENEAKIKVASCSYSLSTSYFLPRDRFEYVGSFHDGHPVSEEPDLLLATPRWDCHKTLSGTVIHTVTRQGAPLLYVIEVSQGSFREKADHNSG